VPGGHAGAMTNARKQKRSTWAVWVWLVAMLLVFYPLTSGPVAWIVEKTDPNYSGWPTTAANIAYLPLAVAVEKTGMQPVLIRYTGLFVGPLGWTPRSD